MAAKMEQIGVYHWTILLLAWSMALGGDGYSCPYGQNCEFVPAPPGKTPACAKPGLTYCTDPDNYPEDLIRQLVKAGKIDISTLFSDESRDDFSATTRPEYPYGYGPNSLHHVEDISLVNDPLSPPQDYNTNFQTRYNHDIFTQKTPLQPPSPLDPSPYNINTYHASNFSKFGFQGYQQTVPRYPWTPSTSQYDEDYKKIQLNRVLPPRDYEYNPNFDPYHRQNLGYNYETPDWFRQAASGVTQYNPNEWWKYITPSRSGVSVERSISYPPRSSVHATRRRRNAELVSESAKRKLTGAEALRIALGLSEEVPGERSRRQANPRAQSLCPTRVDHVPLRAALNNGGLWRYVVNNNPSETQMVRTEVCMSPNTPCGGLCSVPAGYRSECVQKFVQKGLMALDPKGNRVYKDQFWLPVCCECSIMRN